ncbi:gustatory receptor 66, partial [Danaus plexippus plexippus]
GAAFPFIRGE